MTNYQFPCKIIEAQKELVIFDSKTNMFPASNSMRNRFSMLITLFNNKKNCPLSRVTRLELNLSEKLSKKKSFLHNRMLALHGKHETSQAFNVHCPLFHKHFIIAECDLETKHHIVSTLSTISYNINQIQFIVE